MTGEACSSVKLIALVGMLGQTVVEALRGWLDSVLRETHGSYWPERSEIHLLKAGLHSLGVVCWGVALICWCWREYRSKSLV